MDITFVRGVPELLEFSDLCQRQQIIIIIIMTIKHKNKKCELHSRLFEFLESVWEPEIRREAVWGAFDEVLFLVWDDDADLCSCGSLPFVHERRDHRRSCRLGQVSDKARSRQVARPLCSRLVGDDGNDDERGWGRAIQEERPTGSRAFKTESLVVIYFLNPPYNYHYYNHVASASNSTAIIFFYVSRHFFLLFFVTFRMRQFSVDIVQSIETHLEILHTNGVVGRRGTRIDELPRDGNSFWRFRREFMYRE